MIRMLYYLMIFFMILNISPSTYDSMQKWLNLKLITLLKGLDSAAAEVVTVLLFFNL